MREVCVIGLGYIGLPTALILAASDVDVVGIDYNPELVSILNSGKTTFKEDGLDELFQNARDKGISFGTKYIPAKIYIVAVPTPYNEQTKKIDPSYICSAISDILAVCQKDTIIVIESTISPGTIDRYVRPIFHDSKYTLGEDIHIAHAPERIIPGKMITELIYNSRTIGSDNGAIGEQIKSVYSTFCKGEIVLTNIRTAEMTKVVENTFRDINIAFANELAKICRQGGMDVNEIIRIANMHPRVNILQPGPGVGGHCISVDPWFLVGDYPSLSLLIHEARKVNDSMPAYVLKRVNAIMAETGQADISRVGFYGITYKEDVDDIRESPTLQLNEIMKNHLGAYVRFYDPMLKNAVIDGQIMDFDTFLASTDLVVIMVAHKHIKENMDKLSEKIVLDTRNICRLPGCYHL